MHDADSPAPLVISTVVSLPTEGCLPDVVWACLTDRQVVAFF
jgi:hypothetical protein